MRTKQRLIVFVIVLSVMGPYDQHAELEDSSGMAAKGELLVEQGSYAAGIAVLENVLKREPNNVKVLNQLLESYNEYSQQLIEQKRFDQAAIYLEKLELTVQKLDAIPLPQFTTAELAIRSRIEREVASAKAYLLDTGAVTTKDLVSLNTGRQYYNEAVQHFRNHDYKLAEEMLLESVQYDQRNPYAYELLARLASLRQDLEAAEQYYRKAFALNPDSRLKEGFEQVVREKNIDDAQQHYADEHFIIRYRRGADLEGAQIRTYLRDAYRTIAQEFGFYPKNKIPVILYDREEFHSLYADVPHWLVAMFDGKIRLPVYAQDASELNVKRLVHHELAHAFILNLSKMKCPIWLNEGIAQYFEDQVRPVPTLTLERAVQQNQLIQMDDLLFKEFYNLSSHEMVSLYYVQSFSIAKELIQKYRLYRMKQLLVEISNNIPFQDAFEKVYSRSFADYWVEWRETVKARVTVKGLDDDRYVTI